MRRISSNETGVAILSGFAGRTDRSHVRVGGLLFNRLLAQRIQRPRRSGGVSQFSTLVIFLYLRYGPFNPRKHAGYMGLGAKCPVISMPHTTIAFMGVRARTRISHAARITLSDLLPLNSFEDVFDAAAQGKAKYGMIPIENSQAGRVAEIHNLLPRTNLHIVAEHIQKVGTPSLWRKRGEAGRNVRMCTRTIKDCCNAAASFATHELTTHIRQIPATAAPRCG